MTNPVTSVPANRHGSRAIRLARTAVGGVVGSAFDVATLMVVHNHTALPVGVAAFLGAAAGAVVCFAINKWWAFAEKSPVTVQQLARFGAVALGTGLLMAMLMQLLVAGLGVQYLVAKVFAAIGVFMIWSYPAQRRLVFRSSPPRPDLELDVDLDAAIAAVSGVFPTQAP